MLNTKYANHLCSKQKLKQQHKKYQIWQEAVMSQICTNVEQAQNKSIMMLKNTRETKQVNKNYRWPRTTSHRKLFLRGVALRPKRLISSAFMPVVPLWSKDPLRLFPGQPWPVRLSPRVRLNNVFPGWVEGA